MSRFRTAERYPSEHAQGTRHLKSAAEGQGEDSLFLMPVAFSGEIGAYGQLIFEDTFERNESQEKKDEPGNGWTTSSERTANGHKQVDLRDGVVYIHTHESANHAISFRHEFAFTDGTVGLRFKLENEGDKL